MAYATQADLTNVGLPANALATMNSGQITALLQAASDRADAYFRARYGNESVPLVAWDSSITEAVAKIAAFRIMVVRGMKPGGPDFELFHIGHQDALDFLDKVQRQQAHPLVTLAGNATAPQQPNAISRSVTNLVTGKTSPNRGW